MVKRCRFGGCVVREHPDAKLIGTKRGKGMNKRDVVAMVLDNKRPPYVPWSFWFTQEARQTLVRHYGSDEAVEQATQNHLFGMGPKTSTIVPIGDGRWRDHFGVVWNRSIDKDIGVVENPQLPDADLSAYVFPDAVVAGAFDGFNEELEKNADKWRVFSIGFSLFERAWTLRGMEDLLMDFHENPQFVHDLLQTIADYNIAQVKKAMEYDFDAVYFGDDWGQQQGLIMGPAVWREFILPHLRRMYGVVRAAGRKVMIHSCGDVDELFDDLIDAGLNCFNPFQPEVMDVWSLLPQYRGRLSFHGGMSTQKTLPFGTVDDVREETRKLLALGADGGYLFAPAHAVEGDVPLQNMLAFIEAVAAQEGFVSSRK